MQSCSIAFLGPSPAALSQAWAVSQLSEVLRGTIKEAVKWSCLKPCSCYSKLPPLGVHPQDMFRSRRVQEKSYMHATIHLNTIQICTGHLALCSSLESFENEVPPRYGIRLQATYVPHACCHNSVQLWPETT